MQHNPNASCNPRAEIDVHGVFAATLLAGEDLSKQTGLGGNANIDIDVVDISVEEPCAIFG